MRNRTRLSTKLKIGSRRIGLRWKERWSRADLLCEQDRWWVDRNGVMHDINKIDADYQHALLTYFRNAAWRLQLSRLWSGPTGYNEEPEFLDPPEKWIERQPLVVALRRIVEGNG